jgi:hypothetical protein
VAVGFLAVQAVQAGPGRGQVPGQKGDFTGAVDAKGAREKQKKPDRGEYGGRGRERGESHDRSGYDGEKRRYFNDDHRVYIQDYYANQYQRGHCPPGLEKKNNGCMPPGQAKKWEIGRPLARDVVFYDLPQAVTAQLGPPPSQHRYVRVAQDILLMETETGMIVDAIDNLIWEFNR